MIRGEATWGRECRKEETFRRPFFGADIGAGKDYAERGDDSGRSNLGEGVQGRECRGGSAEPVQCQGGVSEERVSAGAEKGSTSVGVGGEKGSTSVGVGGEGARAWFAGGGLPKEKKGAECNP